MLKNLYSNLMTKLMTFAILAVPLVTAGFTTPALADGGPTTPTRTAPSSANNLSSVPSGTKVVIVDSSGDKISLGSQQAADLVASGDPVWCPSTVAIPTPGSN